MHLNGLSRWGSRDQLLVLLHHYQDDAAVPQSVELVWGNRQLQLPDGAMALPGFSDRVDTRLHLAAVCGNPPRGGGRARTFSLPQGIHELCISLKRSPFGTDPVPLTYHCRALSTPTCRQTTTGRRQVESAQSRLRCRLEERGR